MILTKKLLTNLGACAAGIDFCERNQLFGFNLNKMYGVQGDYNFFVNWLSDKLSGSTFDKNGNKIKYMNQCGFTELWVYNDGNQLISHTFGSDNDTFTYDQHGNMIHHQFTSLTQTRTRNWTYDDHQNMIRYDSINGGGRPYWEVRRYDDHNNEITYTDSDGNYITQTYNEHNSVLSHITENEFGTSSIYWKYDDRNRISSKQKVGVTVTTEYWTYDDRNNVLSYVEEGVEEDNYSIYSTYDDRNNKLSTWWMSDSSPDYWTYDDHDNVVTFTPSSGKTETYEYEYWPNGQLKRANGLYVPLIKKD